MVIKNLIYGILSGFSEFLPISARGHQLLLQKLFGIAVDNPLLNLVVHVALLLSVLFSCRTILEAYRKDYQLLSRRGKMRRTAASISRTYELRLLLTAAIPMLAMLILIGERSELHLLWLAVYFIVNGIILFLPDFMLQSNKDAGKMAGFDGVLMGIFYGLSAIPGISAVGAGLSVSVARGADKSHAYNWMLLLTIPATVVLCFFDIIAIFSVTKLTITFAAVVSYLLTMAGAFIAGCLAIMLMRFLMHRVGNSGFAYYSWGVSMLIFILYLVS